MAAHVSAELIDGGGQIAAGKPFTVALRLTVEKEWHVYWKNPGDAGLPVTIAWDLPEGFTAGPILWPHPYRYGTSPEVTYGYEDVVVLPVEITPPAGWQGSSIELRAKAAWLVCREICVSERADVAITLPSGRNAGAGDAIGRALSHVPGTSAGFTADAWRSGSEYLLRLVPADRSHHLPGSAYFFPAEGEVIDHSAEQKPAVAGDTLLLHLPVSTYAQEPSARLRGVLVSGDGREGPEPEVNIEIDVPILHDKN